MVEYIILIALRSAGLSYFAVYVCLLHLSLLAFVTYWQYYRWQLVGSTQLFVCTFVVIAFPPLTKHPSASTM